MLRLISFVAIPDVTQFDPKSQYFDKKATFEKPIWYYVKVKFQKKLKEPISLTELKSHKGFKVFVGD